jgi:signal transduction histidine kinase
MNAIDRARDNYEFFAHMSHELRTPFHGGTSRYSTMNYRTAMLFHIIVFNVYQNSLDACLFCCRFMVDYHRRFHYQQHRISDGLFDNSP